MPLNPKPYSSLLQAGPQAACCIVQRAEMLDAQAAGLSTDWHLDRLPREVQVAVIVGGVEPPLNAPLAWLHEALRQADHFLSIVVHMQ